MKTKTSRASKTAILVAAYRARASARPDPVCRDPWAALLAGDEGRALAERYDPVNPNAELYTAVRTAFIDRLVRGAIERGIGQVVILGAGLDTRAARLSAHDVVFYEVDRPDSQADKLDRLSRLERYPANAAVHVACDFGSEDFVERLRAGGMALGAPAFLIWEGVSYYLPETAVRRTLKRIAEAFHPGSVLVFDYVSRRLVDGLSRQERDQQMRKVLAELGEPLIFGMNDSLPILADAGFRHVRTVSFDQACLSLTGTYDRERQFRFQHIALCSRASVPGTGS